MWSAFALYLSIKILSASNKRRKKLIIWLLVKSQLQKNLNKRCLGLYSVATRENCKDAQAEKTNFQN